MGPDKYTLDWMFNEIHTNMATGVNSLGAVNVIDLDVTYDLFVAVTTTGTHTSAIKIPAGGYVLGAICNQVKTAFSGGSNTTMVMTIGDGTDADRYTATSATIDLATATLKGAGPTAGLMSGDPCHPEEKSVVLVVTVDSAYSTITAGQVHVRLFFLI